jgi:FkbM family methyltransferase
MITDSEFNEILNRYFRENGDHNARLNYDLNRESIVVDCGGYEGRFTENIFNKFGCKVILLEPVYEYYLKCTEKFSSNLNIKVINDGILSSCCIKDLYLNMDGTSSHIKNSESISCSFVNLESLIEIQKIDNIDLLKLNIEGDEYEVLEQLVESPLIHRVKNIQVQFHSNVYDFEFRRENIQKNLELTHYKEWSYEWVWESWKIK